MQCFTEFYRMKPVTSQVLHCVSANKIVAIIHPNKAVTLIIILMH